MLGAMDAGAVIANRFEVLELAGRGGMGAVYKACDREGGGPVAVKVMRSDGAESVERFAREVQLLAQLRHPGIVRYLANGVLADGQPYLVMEWIEGETLATRLDRGPFSLGESVSVVRRIAEPL